jgi:hypothetical protein
LEFLKYLLPQKTSAAALHCKATVVGPVPNTEGSEWRVTGMGTIAEVVVNQGCLTSEQSSLQLCILQVFRYKSRLPCPVTNFYL